MAAEIRQLSEQGIDIYPRTIGQAVIMSSGDSVESSVGSLSSLSTTAKGSLVSAVNEVQNARYHNIPRAVPKDITSYYQDGSLWSRLAGTNGYTKYEDIFAGDFLQMSRAISATNKDTSQQLTGSQYVTIAGISPMMQNGDQAITYEHLVMVPGQGFDGTQHFGKSRMNATNVTTGGIVGSEMFTDILGAVATSGSTASGATINQQLYAEFGTHLKTTREWLANAVDTAKYNRFGTNSGCTTSNAWTSVQAILMSEAEVYGATIFGSSGFDSAMNPYQLPLFAHSKLAANNRSSWYWLRDVASASQFCYCGHYGNAGCSGASAAGGYVRPRFVIA